MSQGLRGTSLPYVRTVRRLGTSSYIKRTMQELHTVPELQWQLAKASTPRPLMLLIKKKKLFRIILHAKVGGAVKCVAIATAKVKI